MEKREIPNIFKIKSSSKWKKVNGKIIHSKYESISRINLIDMPDSVASYEHKADIKYEYFIGGKKYISDKLLATLPNVFYRKTNAQQMLDKFPKDKIVTVYYNPKKGDNV